MSKNVNSWHPRDIISGGNDADVRHYNLERSECTVYQHHAKKILRLSVCPSMPDCFLTASADGRPPIIICYWY
jgi:WD40 repeat protein